MNRAYLAAIERAFLARAGRGLMLSAADVELVRQWARADVPVDAVLSALESCFARPGLDPARVRGLAFIRREVEAEAALRRSLAVGGVSSGSTLVEGELRGRLVEHLRSLIAPLPAGLAVLVRRAADRVEAVGADETDDAIWARWAEARAELVEGVWQSLSEVERERLAAEVTAGLGIEQRRADPVHFAETWRAHRDRALSRLIGLPDDLELYALATGT